jgi:integrase
VRRRPYSTEPTPHGTRYYSQPVDPVTGRRLRVTAESPEELAVRTARVREVRRDLKWGGSPEQAKAKLRPAVGRALTARACWEAWERTTAPQNQRSLQSVWRTKWEAWIGTRRAWDVDGVLLASWEADLTETGISAGTIWQAFDCLKAAFRRRIPRELPALPWGEWHPQCPRRGGRAPWEPARPAVRSFEETARLVEVAAAEHNKRPTHAFVALVVALTTGLRQGELAGLRWDDLELDPARPLLLRVRRQAPAGWHRGGAREPATPPKGKRERRQSLHPQAAAALLDWRRHCPTPGPLDPVFPAPKRHPETGPWRRAGAVLDPAIVQRWARAAELRDPDNWGAHSLRHSFVTLEVVASGGNLRATQLRAGHADARVTQGYLHALGADLPSPAVPSLPLSSFPALQEGKAAPSFAMLPPPEEGTGQLDGAATPILPEDAPRSHAPSFAELASGDEDLPPEVRRKARAAYSSAYKRAQRQGLDAAECQRAGMAGRRATLGAWGRLRRRHLQAKPRSATGEAQVNAQVNPQVTTHNQPEETEK